MNADFLLLIGVFEALFLGILVLTKNKKEISDYLLALVLLLNAVTILLSWLEIYNRANGYPFPTLISVSPPFILLHGPALWLYVKSLTTENFQLRFIHLLHIIPFLMSFLLLGMEVYFLPVEDKIIYDSMEVFKQHWLYPVIMAAILLSIQSYLWNGMLHIKRYKRKIKNYFSTVEQFNLRWLRFVLITAMVFYAVISFTYILDYFFHMLPYNLLQITGFVIASAYILVLGFSGLKQGNIFTSHDINLILDENPHIKSNQPLLSSEEQFVKRLLNFMKEEKPHLNPDLTLSGLSKAMTVSPEYLSGILNGRLNSSFFDFINHYRIECFKQKCRKEENQNLTLLGIAFECGFNSKATFNRVFKKRTGLTPGAYARQVSIN